jgi:hypothetical protein
MPFNICKQHTDITSFFKALHGLNEILPEYVSEPPAGNAAPRAGRYRSPYRPRNRLSQCIDPCLGIPLPSIQRPGPPNPTSQTDSRRSGRHVPAVYQRDRDHGCSSAKDHKSRPTESGAHLCRAPPSSTPLRSGGASACRFPCSARPHRRSHPHD